MELVYTPQAPAAIGPYSQAYKHNGFVFTSGQIGADPETGALADTIQEQAEMACKNVKAVLEAAGSSVKCVLKTTCFLADIKDFSEFNSIYAKYFTEKPARSCFAVKDLPKGALCEIEAVAVVQ